MTATSSFNPNVTAPETALSNGQPEQSPETESPPASPWTSLRERQAGLRQRLASAAATEQLWAIATEHLRTTFAGSRACIYHFESQELGRVLAESAERGWTPTHQEILPATFLGLDQREDYERQGTVMLEYSATTPVTPYQLQLLEKYQVRSSLATPVYFGGRLWGLLIVQQCDRARTWTDAEQLEIEQIALALALALERGTVETELQAQQERDRAVTKVIDRIRRSLDIKTIFQTTTQELRQLLKADRVVLYRFNGDWSGKYVAESVGGGWTSLMQTPPDEALHKANSENCSLQDMAEQGVAVSDTHLQQTQGGVYRQGQRFRVVADVQAQGFPSCYLELLDQMQARAYLIVGVYQGEQLWGLLAAYQCSGPRAWADTDVRLTGQVAEQLGVALQQALVMRHQRQQAERLDKAIERERTLAIVSDRIKNSQSAEAIFRAVTEEARKIIGSDRVAVYRFNPDWSGTFIAESVGSDWRSLLQDQVVDDRILQGTQLNIDTEGCTIKDMRIQQMASQDTYLRDTKGGKYAKGDAARVCDDIYAAGFPPCYIELLESFQARAYVTVPIFLKDKLWGLMPCYQCSEPRHWESEEIQLMINLSAQLGIALQRAADIDAVQQQTQLLAKAVDRERAIAAVSNKIKDTQDANSIFQVATEEARKLIGSDRVALYRFSPDWSGIFIAESVGKSWKSLLRSQMADPTILQGTRSNIDTAGCTIKDMRIQQMATRSRNRIRQA
ncbi:MAG: GAF domain-containing protein [Spirulina sp. SIO3F2]|nr:GAF domain-containing protein [Spirulina sp. SIO3F2]